jgi:dihydrofolate synthase/folylpolyglutamate synthase
VSPERASFKLERARQLLDAMGDPHRTYPLIHITGTNGKGSTAAITTQLLVARGLSVGTFSSPHLDRFNERMAWNGEPISDGALAEVLEGVALVESLLDDRPTWFELVTVAAYRWFADIAVDVAVVEVGLGGRWDTTNVADGQVAVVTNIGLDHVDVIGPTKKDIAEEKAGIVKPGSTLILGETDPELTPIFRSAGADVVWARGDEFDCYDNRVAVGGRLLDLRTPGATYDDAYLPLHGRHQGDNAAAAVSAVEAFFGTPLEEDVVAEGLAGVKWPGRLEVMSHRPLVVVDGAHNPDGARALSEALDEEFAAVETRVIVIGSLAGRDPGEVLDALDVGRARLVVACRPATGRALPAEDLARAAEARGVRAVTAPTVAGAVDRALAEAGVDDLVLVTGSLYVVGEARARLRAE